MTAVRTLLHLGCLTTLLFAVAPLQAQTGEQAGKSADAKRAADKPAGELAGKPAGFDELKKAGALRSTYRTHEATKVDGVVPEPDLETFRNEIRPILEKACFECHGERKQKAELRVDTLDADLFGGKDVDWWLEVLAVLTNGEMPPEDDVEMADADRARVIDWLSGEMQVASATRRASAEHSSFRRLTRYEYDYALQDLLGVPFRFSDDLPPDPVSEDGFENSSEALHLTGMQFRAYLDAGRRALQLATVRGEQPELLQWRVAMGDLATHEWQKQDRQLENLRKKHAKDPEKLEKEVARHQKRARQRPHGVFFHNPETGRMARQSWGYNGAKFARKPSNEIREAPLRSDQIAVIPPKQNLIVELGNRLPDRGTLRVRVRASREATGTPTMRLLFGWQASNDSKASFRIDAEDVVVTGEPGTPAFYEWRVPLSQIYPRNLVRKTGKMGATPSPSEYIRIVNVSTGSGDIRVDYVEVSAPFHEQWPPASHLRIFGADAPESETERARAVLTSFLPRAWRRDVTAAELAQKLQLFGRLRKKCTDFEQAMIEVLASALASPNFLYVASDAVGQAEPAGSSGEAEPAGLSGEQLATRLSMFLWCSSPDRELLEVARDGKLQDEAALAAQVQRLLASDKAQRFSRHFVRQWLNLSLLDYLHVDRKKHPRFDPSLREAMAEEPIAFFRELLRHDHSVLEFLHADFAMVNARLAAHYGLADVTGTHFRRVELPTEHVGQQGRGGLLTQAGILAMNSDGIDSHPLKRGIWMLERLLNDPPPPPPPAVPEIDLADPEIAKLTLKQRIENHRDDPACMSCHQKIDPWGIAFEDFDAVGRFRTEIAGQPVDSVSVLFNKQRLDGADGLKRFLLEHRQDQFVRAMVYKLATFALGRPLTFGDRAAIDEITAQTRKRGDGLATMISVLVASDLFRGR